MQISFNDVPEAIAHLTDEVGEIKSLINSLLTVNHKASSEPEEILIIQQAAKVVNLTVPTMYGLVSKREIPVHKKNKRLYFFRSELLEWIKSGRRKTLHEIDTETDQFLAQTKGGKKS